MPTFTVPGKPIGQPRHRSKRTGHHYIPADHAIHAYKDLIRLSCKQRHPFEGPVSVKITAYMPRPADQKKDKLLPEMACPHIGTPDCDNIAKGILDALNGKAWRDDKQVNEITVRKLFVPRGTEPKTIITIEPGGSL